MIRVTEAIKNCGLMPGVDFGSEEAAWRGSCVHETLHLVNKGTLDPESVHEDVQPYIAAYKKFLVDTGFKPEIWEREVKSELFGIVGHLDVEGICRGERWLIDYKTSLTSRGIGKWVGFQTALYNFLLGPPQPRRRFGLKLLANGFYNLVEFKKASDLMVGLACVTVTNAKKEIENGK